MRPGKADDRLGVLQGAVARQPERFRERQPARLQHFVILGSRFARVEVAGEEHVDDFRQHPRGAEELAEGVPTPCRDAHFLGEFALRTLDRRFAVVELAGRQFRDPPAGGVAELAEQADTLLRVDRHDGRAARVMRDLQFGDVPVGQRHPLEVQRQDPAGVNVPNGLGGHHGSTGDADDHNESRSMLQRTRQHRLW